MRSKESDFFALLFTSQRSPLSERLEQATFYHPHQTCLAINQIVAGCKKLLQKVESSSTFCNKTRNLYMLRVLLAQGPVSRKSRLLFGPKNLILNPKILNILDFCIFIFLVFIYILFAFVFVQTQLNLLSKMPSLRKCMT